jgi:hypothetical protein
MIGRNAEEAKAHYTEKMGEELGTQFAMLWLEVDGLGAMWGEYVELFSPESVEVLNQTAPALFRIIQVVLWEHALLQVARLTDRTRSSGKENLTILNLPELVDDHEMKKTLIGLVNMAVSKTKFCRDWRNRHIAHRDLGLLVKKSEPLEIASGIQVRDALDAIKFILCEVQFHYMESWPFFPNNVGEAGNVQSLLQLLCDGLKARKLGVSR